MKRAFRRKKWMITADAVGFIFLLSILFQTGLFAQVGLINGGFEAWQDTIIAVSPTGWETDTGNESAELTTMMDTAAASGRYALKLMTAVDSEGDTIFGYAVYGDVGQEMPRGKPWTLSVDSLHFWTRYSVEAEDSALLWLQVKKNGEMIVEVFHVFKGANETWHPLSIGLPFDGGVPVTPDTIMVAFVSSDPMNGKGVPGSWIAIDSTYFTLEDNPEPIFLPNHSFEQWEDIGYLEPEGWTSSNQWYSGTEYTPVTRSSDAYAGNYAARLEIHERDDHTTNSSMLYGKGLWDDNQGVPISEMPKAITGAYKYYPALGDTAFISVYFTEENRDSHVGACFMQLTDSTSAYKTFGLPINVMSENEAKYAYIQIHAGNIGGSVLYIDELQFASVSGVTFKIKDTLGMPVNFAKIEVDMLWPGFTGGDGEWVTELPKGSFTYKVSSPGFFTHQGVLVVDTLDKDENVMLIPTMPIPSGLIAKQLDNDTDMVYFSGDQLQFEITISSMPDEANGSTPDFDQFIFNENQESQAVQVFSTLNASSISDKKFQVTGTVADVQLTGVIGLRIKVLSNPVGEPFPLLDTEKYGSAVHSDWGLALTGVKIPVSGIVADPPFHSIDNLYETELPVSIVKEGQGSIRFAEGLNIIDNRAQLIALESGLDIASSGALHYAEVDPASLTFLAGSHARITFFNVPEAATLVDLVTYKTEFGEEATGTSMPALIANAERSGTTFTFEVGSFSRYSTLVADGVSVSQVRATSPLSYPNPFTERLYLSDPASVSRVIVTTLQGVVVMNRLTKGESEITTVHLPSGAYLLRMKLTDGSERKHIVIKY